MATVPNVIMINRHMLADKPTAWARASTLLRLWRDRARQRRSLAALDERSLQDIGLSRATALGEADKPFWRA